MHNTIVLLSCILITSMIDNSSFPYGYSHSLTSMYTGYGISLNNDIAWNASCNRSNSTLFYLYLTVGGRPSQVNRGSIRVSYTEDLREGYRGYSVANISWNKPEGNIASIHRRQSVAYIYR